MNNENAKILSDIFKLDKDEMAPGQFKQSGFWDRQPDISPEATAALQEWKKLSPKTQRLISESISMDVDSKEDENGKKPPLKELADHAQKLLLQYMKPERFQALAGEVEMRDSDAIEKILRPKQYSGTTFNPFSSGSSHRGSRTSSKHRL
jgi:hypothetical protein